MRNEIELVVVGHVATITLIRPAKLNAMTKAMTASLENCATPWD